MAVAKVFRMGRSEALWLPKEFRVDADTVHLKRTDDGFLVITKEQPIATLANSKLAH